jgi:hypothetical protein
VPDTNGRSGRNQGRLDPRTNSHCHCGACRDRQPPVVRRCLPRSRRYQSPGVRKVAPRATPDLAHVQRVSYTSSALTSRSCFTASFAMPASSASVATMPVGCVVSSLSARARGVIAARSASTSIASPTLVGDECHDHPLAARHRDDGGVGAVEGFDQQHLEAGLNETDDGCRDRLGAGVVGDAAGPRRVLIDALRYDVHRALQYRGGSILFRKALAEVHPLMRAASADISSKIVTA